jgi:hypothetical protein
VSAEPDLDFPSLWSQAIPWSAYLRPGMEQYQLWDGVYRHVLVPGWALEGFLGSPARRLLVLAADWCGDAANTVPVLARLVDLVHGMELRILERDRFPQVMARYLTNGTRSIPIVIALDEALRELGHWGPRPAALQEWAVANKKTMPSPQRYAYARKWYAKDKGESTLRELLAALPPGSYS